MKATVLIGRCSFHSCRTISLINDATHDFSSDTYSDFFIDNFSTGIIAPRTRRGH